MSDADRERWDTRYAPKELVMGFAPKPLVVEMEHVLPRTGRALEIACGEGQLAAWLARRGLEVTAVDISPVALGKAQDLARAAGHADRVRVVQADLDDGLPRLDAGFDLVTCVDFYAPAVMSEARALLAPGGMMLVQVLLQAPGGDSAHRASPGETLGFAAGLQVHFYREGRISGRALAQLLARRSPAPLTEFS
jgi:SAM-dependent methyltransferase